MNSYFARNEIRDAFMEAAPGEMVVKNFGWGDNFVCAYGIFRHRNFLKPSELRPLLINTFVDKGWECKVFSDSVFVAKKGFTKVKITIVITAGGMEMDEIKLDLE